MYVLDTKTTLSRLGADSQKKKSIPADSVSVSCIATPGLVILNHIQRQTNQQINSIVPFQDHTSEFIFWSCKMLSSELTTGGSGGSVFHNMNKSTFSALKVIYPRDRLIKEFKAIVEGLHTRILQNELESRTLAQTRDLLLPKLMSGALRVGAAEKIVEGAL